MVVDQNREQSHSLREKSGASQAPHLSVSRKSVKASNSAQTKSGPTKRPSVKKRTGHVGRNVRNGRDARIAHNTQKGDSTDFGASGASQIDFSRSQKQGEGFFEGQQPSIRAGAFEPKKTSFQSEAQTSERLSKPSFQSSSDRSFRTKRRSSKKLSLSERFKASSTRSKVFIIVFTVLFVALLVATGLLCWKQWFRFDDNKDFQGTWQVEGTTASFVITDSEIQLTSDVAYSYELDTFNKTISFNFGNLTGGGTYAFSPDRTVLIITEPGSEEGGSSIPSKLLKLTNADGSAVVHEDKTAGQG